MDDDNPALGVDQGASGSALGAASFWLIARLT